MELKMSQKRVTIEPHKNGYAIKFKHRIDGVSYGVGFLVDGEGIDYEDFLRKVQELDSFTYKNTTS